MFTLVVQSDRCQLQAPLADKNEIENLQSGLLARRDEIAVDLDQPPALAAAIVSRLQNLERYGNHLTPTEQEAGSRLICGLAAHLLLSRPRWRAAVERAVWALALRVRVAEPAGNDMPPRIACDIAVDEAVDLSPDAQGGATRLLLGLQTKS